MRRIVKRTIFLVFMLALVGFFTLMFGGCVPQSVKKSGALAQQAITVAETHAKNVVATFEVSDDEAFRVFAEIIKNDIVIPLQEALAFFKPVMKIIGYPKGVDIYVPGDPSNERLASRATIEAKLATMLEDQFAKFAKNKLPEVLSKHIPDPVADKVTWEEVLAMIAAVVTGYGGSKFGGKGLMKLFGKKGNNGTT